ncbi:hypothetical protein Ngar_c29730 [Candidatus Nitrososphaera gargensis Ga9.2]|uniref:Uncharacterized protein n=1 Tax=Nitrososphaera gargensis (strain Ga9.2) TaxID=1237085 RepID=K0IEV5_NITGG|nr:hypothetical protein [Candidatus Nitrososphaera gargensis]AFU59891.1 hypothetical protein Ngar_c29730 [Candidatus Nitrososphaera gargensis Ga9.2]
MVELKILKGKKNEGLSVYLAKKSITINSEGDVPVLEVTNEYGNSVRYEISDSYRFDNLHANLWQFIKDSQH